MKMFKVSWTGYPGDPKPETHDISYFIEMGFDVDDIADIDNLGLRDEHHIGSPLHDCVTFERIV